MTEKYYFAFILWKMYRMGVFFFLECLVEFSSGTHTLRQWMFHLLWRRKPILLFLSAIWFHALHHILPIPLETPCRAVYGESEEQFLFCLPFVLYLRDSTQQPIPAFLPENLMGRGVCRVTIHGGRPRVRHNWAKVAYFQRISGKLHASSALF